jgi:hypothetical protein
MSATRSLSVVVLGLIACGPGVYVRDHAERDLRKRAAFEMDCVPEELVLTRLSADNAIVTGKESDAPKTIGVSGCGKKGTYVYLADKGYVLNSASNEASAK